MKKEILELIRDYLIAAGFTVVQELTMTVGSAPNQDKELVATIKIRVQK